MQTFRAILVALAAVALSGVPFAPSAGQVPPSVRVGLMIGQPEVTLSADGLLEVVDVIFDRREQLSRGAWTFRAAPSGIEIPGLTRYGDVVRVRAAGDRPVRVEDRMRAYRGTIELRRTERGLTVINELELEPYLYGVIKLEINPAWPPEAVRAQAVAARTLAVHSLGRFAREGYDLRDTTDSQVYGGVTFEDPRATEAVDATRGLILVHAGRPILAAYHADSGGRTESSENVWGTAYPYLRGVDDPYSAGSPYERWAVSLALSEIGNRLRRGGLGVQDLRGLEVARTSESGRVLTLRVLTDGASLELTGHRFRLLMGADVIRSTKFAVRVEGPSAVFEGSGWGHGVGMSQWGARGMAMRGMTFAQILRHYYTGVEVVAR
ncbi:MAG: SpoIID/LytB domain-containing protein [Armatimonadota bacterium]|nr:SpoIID/LytB domain-containing protein [Armatimonadota bacterium]